MGENAGACMRQELIDPGNLYYPPCRYGASRMFFRGPGRTLDRPYIVFIGGTETYGKYIEAPFPMLVEAALDRPCVNLGCVNGGIDAFVHDPVIMDLCHAAELTIVQIMGANHLSNRLYTVHPRRNDRFLRPMPMLQALYPEVDFTEFAFTRHLLGALHAISPVRFEIIVQTLREAWVNKMQRMLTRIGRQSLLLWFSADPLSDADWSARPNHLQTDPLFITAAMIDRLHPLVRSLVVVTPSPAALAQGSAGMRVPPSQQGVAAGMLGVRCHEEAATALIRNLQDL